MDELKMDVFARLNAINCNEHTEKKNGLTYLSWAWAWAEVKKAYPNATYTIYENRDEWNYFTDGRTCWVKTGVTIEGIEHIEYLPVMDHRNNSISADKVTSFDVNKAIQRSLTKACARHGLGLYIYAGEDLPETVEEDKAPEKKPEKKAEKPKAPEKKEAPKPEPPKQETAPKAEVFHCSCCSNSILPYVTDQGKQISIRQHVNGSQRKFGKILCIDCIEAGMA